MKTVLKLVLAGVILMIVGVAGCAALVGGAASEIDKELDKQQSEHSITVEEFKSVKPGTTLKTVKKKFGEPDDEQVTKVEGLKSDCIYYNVEGGELLDRFQFCFSNGKLDSKSKY